MEKRLLHFGHTYGAFRVVYIYFFLYHHSQVTIKGARKLSLCILHFVLLCVMYIYDNTHTVSIAVFLSLFLILLTNSCIVGWDIPRDSGSRIC